MDSARLWERIDSLSELYTPRTGHVAVCCEDSVYVFGGTDGNSRQNDLHKYIIDENYWQQLEPGSNPPLARSGAQAVALHNEFYIFGGYTKKDGDYFNDLYRFSIEENKWHRINFLADSEVPDPRTDHSIIIHGEHLYVFGGYDGQRRFNDVYSFEIANSTWKKVEVDYEQAPEGRFGHSAAENKDRMIVFGGWNGHETLNEVWSYSIYLARWSLIVTSGYISPRYRHSATIFGQNMYVFGGVNKEQQRFNDIHTLNLLNSQWSRVIASGAEPSARTFHRAIMYNGYMYIFGGFDGSRRNDTFRIYLQDEAPEEDLESITYEENKQEDEVQPYTWQLLKTFGDTYSQRTGHAVVSYKKKFFVFGGTDETSRQNDMHYYDIETHLWQKLNCKGNPPCARSGSKGERYKDYIYYFGGYTKKDGDYFNDLHRFNIKTQDWALVNSTGEVPCPRTDHTVAVFEKYLYVFAGYDGKNRFNDLISCNLESHEWRKLEPTGSIPITRFGHTTVVHADCMYIFGGWDGHDTLDDLYMYAFISNIWYEIRRTVGMQPNQRYRHSCVVYEKSLFIFGGVDKQQTRYNDLVEFNIETREWSVKRVCGTIPTARTFHRAVVYKDEMYVLGGFDGKRQNDMYMIKLSNDLNIPSRPQSTYSSSVMEYDENDSSQPTYEELRKMNNRLQTQINFLSERLRREEDRDVCKVCFERDINTVLLECAHRLVCDKCARNFSTCPVCRQPLTRYIITYQGY